MVLNQFKDRLLEVSRSACVLKDFLKEYVETVLDNDQYNKYDIRINDVLWDLNNVRIDCEMLLVEMQLNEDIE